MKRRQVIVVGGGASGLVAAISAAREGAEVTIIEQKEMDTNDKTNNGLAKVFASGTADGRFGRLHGTMGNVMCGDGHVETLKDIPEERLPKYELSSW